MSSEIVHVWRIILAGNSQKLPFVKNFIENHVEMGEKLKVRDVGFHPIFVASASSRSTQHISTVLGGILGGKMW